MIDAVGVVRRSFVPALPLFFPLILPAVVTNEYFSRLASSESNLLMALVYILLWQLLGCLAFPATFALTHFLSDSSKSSEARRRESFRATWGDLFSILGTGLLLIVALLIGMLFLMLPGLYVLLISFPLVPVMVCERCFGLQALKRCRVLMRGHKRRALLPAAVLTVLCLMVGYACEWAAGSCQHWSRILVSLTVGPVFMMYWAAFSLLLYRDILARGTLDRA